MLLIEITRIAVVLYAFVAFWHSRVMWPFKVADKILAMTQFANCIFFSRPENGMAEDPGIVVGLSLGLRLGLQLGLQLKYHRIRTAKTKTAPKTSRPHEEP